MLGVERKAWTVNDSSNVLSDFLEARPHSRWSLAPRLMATFRWAPGKKIKFRL
jgi:hypothetical protein